MPQFSPEQTRVAIREWAGAALRSRLFPGRFPEENAGPLLGVRLAEDVGREQYEELRDLLKSVAARGAREQYSPAIRAYLELIAKSIASFVLFMGAVIALFIAPGVLQEHPHLKLLDTGLSAFVIAFADFLLLREKAWKEAADRATRLLLDIPPLPPRSRVVEEEFPGNGAAEQLDRPSAEAVALAENPNDLAVERQR